MKHRLDPQAFAVSAAVHLPFQVKVVLLLLLALLVVRANAQQPPTAPKVDLAPLTVDEVVHNLVQMNRQRLQALLAYQGTRTYRVVYRGFPGTRKAEMFVTVKYLSSPLTKEFVVESATGSKLIIDKVFKKLLEAEREALDADMQRRSALNGDNYAFTLVGYETGPSGPMYVLSVGPRKKDKFLYRGKIWVDAKEFAVVRLEAEPAKNPSFWTKKSEIVQVYRKVNDFWLPASNSSVSEIRLGGRAELTIEYDSYEITDADAVGNLSTMPATSSANAGGNGLGGRR